jgi:bacteriochlorophyll 4-vinyl reductase
MGERLRVRVPLLKRYYRGMRDAVVGRVLVASLHQGIADIIPARLTFYESWLHAEGLRDGTIGLAPLYAVLSFLRQEGDEAYERITTCAGEYAAEWTVQSLPPFERALIKASPAWLRSRLLLRLLGRLVHESYTGSRAIARLRNGHASVDLRASVFCSVREPLPHPLCGFYVAAFTRLHALFDFSTQVEITSCRGTGKPACLMTFAPADIRANGSHS